MKNVVIVRGAGDIATGVIVKLNQCGYKVIALEIERPTAIRRFVSFGEAVYDGKVEIEGVFGRLAESVEQISSHSMKDVSIMVDRNADVLNHIEPIAFVDATLNKSNNNTAINDAQIVIGVGPGFEVEQDCHAIVETKRGHDLGRVYYRGSASENTGIPGLIGGFTHERVIRSATKGDLTIHRDITSIVEKGDVIARVDGELVYATIDGIIRGMIRNGSIVHPGMKIADIDPRIDQIDNCYKISDKARCVAGGVLEAILNLKGGVV